MDSQAGARAPNGRSTRKRSAGLPVSSARLRLCHSPSPNHLHPCQCDNLPSCLHSFHFSATRVPNQHRQLKLRHRGGNFITAARFFSPAKQPRQVHHDESNDASPDIKPESTETDRGDRVESQDQSQLPDVMEILGAATAVDNSGSIYHTTHSLDSGQTTLLSRGKRKQSPPCYSHRTSGLQMASTAASEP